MGTDLVKNFKSERICCKISVSKKLGRGRLAIVRKSETGMSQTQEIKAFSQKMNAAVLIFGGVTKIQIQIFNCQFSRGLIQPANRVAPTTEWNYTNVVVNCLLISYL